METDQAPRWTVLLSSNCDHCRSFAEQYKDWLHGGVTAVLVEDILHYTVLDLLKVLGVNSFPAIVYEKEVYEGENAFDKMQEITGVSWSGTKGNTTIQALRAMKHCVQCDLHLANG